MPKRLIAFVGLYTLAMLVTFVFPQAGVWGFLFESNEHPPFKSWGDPLMKITDRWSFWIGAAMGASVLLHWGRFRQGRVFSHPQTLCLVLFSVNACAVTTWAYDLSLSWKEATGILKWLLVYVCIIRTHSDRRWLPMVLIIYMLACIDVGWNTTMNPKPGRFVWGGPVTTDGENFMSAHAVALLPFIAVYTLSSEVSLWLRGICLVGAPLVLNIIAYDQSRGAFLALIAMASGMLLFSRGRLRMLTVIGLMLGALVVAVLFHGKFWERMSTIERYEQDSSAMGRIRAWNDAWELSLENPFGYGGEAFDAGVKRQSKSTHNMYLECLVAWGFQGTLFWFGFLGFTFLDCWKLRRRLGRDGGWPASRESLEATAMLAALVGMLVASVFLNRMRWELWWVFAAYVVCMKNIWHSRGWDADTEPDEGTPPSADPGGSHVDAAASRL